MARQVELTAKPSPKALFSWGYWDARSHLRLKQPVSFACKDRHYEAGYMAGRCPQACGASSAPAWDLYWSKLTAKLSPVSKARVIGRLLSAMEASANG